ncbi:MAG: hypothetical protein CMK06_01615 [Ponticaulis sp.]|nr:hypothetical protein [Ponticaulis sp.]
MENVEMIAFKALALGFFLIQLVEGSQHLWGEDIWTQDPFLIDLSVLDCRAECALFGNSFAKNIQVPVFNHNVGHDPFTRKIGEFGVGKPRIVQDKEVSLYLIRSDNNLSGHQLEGIFGHTARDTLYSYVSPKIKALRYGVADVFKFYVNLWGDTLFSVGVCILHKAELSFGDLYIRPNLSPSGFLSGLDSSPRRFIGILRQFKGVTGSAQRFPQEVDSNAAKNQGESGEGDHYPLSAAVAKKSPWIVLVKLFTAAWGAVGCACIVNWLFWRRGGF